MKEADKNDKIKRFLTTKLSMDQFKVLINKVREYDMWVMCTPFDEISVDNINKMDIDIIKIGSPSLFDYPLLEKVRDETCKPIIISSGGCDITHIDKLVKMFSNKNLGLMHCVSIYPTPTEKLYLNNITKFISRYPKITIGFSTHENPADTNIIKVAYALGARMFEKHVGVDILNKYSASPEQTEEWVKSYIETKDMIGGERLIDESEKRDLEKLYRGVFLKKDVKKNELIRFEDVYFAFPRPENGINSGEFKPFITNQDLNIDSPISYSNEYNKSIIDRYVNDMKNFYPNLPNKFTISHHYNIENIYEYGCVMFTNINEKLYSKKTIIQLPNQKHPEHFHKIKTETFLITEGTLLLVADGKTFILNKNEFFTINPGVKHSFSTETGVIFEEIATSITETPDSYYSDQIIQEKSEKERKTLFTDLINVSNKNMLTNDYI